MKKIDLIHRLAALDKKGVYVLSKADIGKMFPDEGAKAMEKSLQRMVADRLLIRAARGIYVNPAAASRKPQQPDHRRLGQGDAARRPVLSEP